MELKCGFLGAQMPDPSAHSTISVVIASLKNNRGLLNSIKNVFAQTCPVTEIIVILNSDEQILLGLPQDSRIKIRIVDRSCKPGAAWNAGIHAASGDWIALLNSEDEWFPEKLSRQTEAARLLEYEFPVISCKITARRPGAEFIWPRRLPRQDEKLSEYLFCRNSFSYGEGLIKPSTLLARRELFSKIPFNENLNQHEDYDWLLRAGALKNVQVQFASPAECLTVWNMEVNYRADWEGTLDWLRENKSLFTPRAYASFLLTDFSNEMASTGRWEFFFKLLKEAFRNGRPRILDLLIHSGYWIKPR